MLAWTITPAFCISLFLLQWIKQQRPVLFLLSELDWNSNNPFFLSRFKEAFHTLYTILECLDATLPSTLPSRWVVESFLTSDILNAVACEGSHRMVRAEKLEQWTERLMRLGFDLVPFRDDTVDALAELVAVMDKRFRLQLSKGTARLSWNGTQTLFLQSWR